MGLFRYQVAWLYLEKMFSVRLRILYLNCVGFVVTIKARTVWALNSTAYAKLMLHNFQSGLPGSSSASIQTPCYVLKKRTPLGRCSGEKKDLLLLTALGQQ